MNVLTGITIYSKFCLICSFKVNENFPVNFPVEIDCLKLIIGGREGLEENQNNDNLKHNGRLSYRQIYLTILFFQDTACHLAAST